MSDYSAQYIKPNLEGAIIRIGQPVAAYDYGIRFASASDINRFPCIGVVTFVRSDRRNMRVSQSGYVSRDDWTLIAGSVGLTPGERYYVSTDPGKLTTEGVQPGAIENRLVGVATTDQTLQIMMLGEDSTSILEPPAVGEIMQGSIDLGSGIDSGSVTGLALANPPLRVFVSVRRPADALSIGANVIDGSLTSDGFDFSLTAETDSGLYKLDYLVVPS